MAVIWRGWCGFEQLAVGSGCTCHVVWVYAAVAERALESARNLVTEARDRVAEGLGTPGVMGSRDGLLQTNHARRHRKMGP